LPSPSVVRALAPTIEASFHGATSTLGVVEGSRSRSPFGAFSQIALTLPNQVETQLANKALTQKTSRTRTHTLSCGRARKLIESYSFGKIKISGKLYTSDVIIYPDHIDDHWWRKEGHRLSIDDLRDVWQVEPEVLIVGTGYYSFMKVPNELREQVTSKNVELIVESTKEAYKTYNRLTSTRRTVAAFHLTC